MANLPLSGKRTVLRGFLAVFGALCVLITAFSAANAQTATLLPNGEQTFVDANGAPYAGGSVYFYIPSTTTPKNTWQNSGETVLNTNPVVLDSAGRAIIYGSGQYRQILKDSSGNQIWDQLTQDVYGLVQASINVNTFWGGTSGGTANAQTITVSSPPAMFAAGQVYYFTVGTPNTGAATLQVNSFPATPVLLNGTQIQQGNLPSGDVVQVVYDGTNFNLLGPGINLDPRWFGAKGDGQQRDDCSVSNVGGVGQVTCSGYSFVTADVGKLGGFLAAGPTVAGGINQTVVSTIASISSGKANLSAAITSAVASGGTFAWGHDDTAFINDAIAAVPTNTAAQSGPASAVSLSQPGYIVTGTLALGPTGAPALLGTQRTPIYCLMSSGNTGLAGEDCISLTGAGATGAGGSEQDMKPTRLENVLVDAMNTGRHCVVQGASTDAVIRNVILNNCWMDGLALKITANFTDIKQMRLDNVSVGNVGLHCFYLYAAGNTLFINDNVATKLACQSPSLNGAAILAAAGGPAAPWSSWSGGNQTTYNKQLGTAFYVMDQATNSAGFYRFTCISCIFIGSASNAQANGSNLNPDPVVFADGSAAHAIEGAGVPGTGSGTNFYMQFQFINGEAENLGGTVISGGFQFFAETPAQMGNLVDLLFGGSGGWALEGDNFSTNQNGDFTLVPNVGGYPWGVWGGDLATQPINTTSAPIATTSVSGVLRVPTMTGRWAPSGNTYNLNNQLGAAGVVIDETNHKICWYEPATTTVFCAAGS